MYQDNKDDHSYMFGYHEQGDVKSEENDFSIARELAYQNLLKSYGFLDSRREQLKDKLFEAIEAYVTTTSEKFINERAKETNFRR